MMDGRFARGGLLVGAAYCLRQYGGRAAASFSVAHLPNEMPKSRGASYFHEVVFFH